MHNQKECQNQSTYVGYQKIKDLSRKDEGIHFNS